jgi:diguanylate cyclase (GGDEF)-like protein
MSAIVLLITRDRDLTERIANSLSDFPEAALTLLCVEHLADATQRLSLNDSIDAVIMDWALPVTRGYEALLTLVDAAPHLPIIVLGDDLDLRQQMNMIEHGAQDYLLKRRAETDTVICMVHGAIARKSQESVLFCGKDRTITYVAEHDGLTALPNRALLDDRLERGIAMAQRHGRRLAVLSIDLDHFKHVNDSLGTMIGDQLLRSVALRIGPCLRSSDTVSRQGGDEFLVLLSEISHAGDAALIADKIRRAILEPYTIEQHLLHLTTSIGVSLYPQDGADAQTLIQCADTAMVHAKKKGRNQSRFFQEEMNFHAAVHQIMAGDLSHALKRGEFVLEYQPKVNLMSGAITGVEALIRWQHPSRGFLLPPNFIQVAEDCGMIAQMDQWTLEAACMQAQTWLAAGLQFGTMAVNISAVEFRDDRFFDDVYRILKSTGLPPRYLELELTETAAMRNFEDATAVLQSLSALGVRIAIDDFGTGYSNLSYLRRFPVNTLKLHKSFVHDVPESPNMATIVRSVIHMGQNLHLRVIADGVENAQQLKFLQINACAEGQGSYFSKPVNSLECQALFSQGGRQWAWHLPFCRAPSY